MIVHIKITMINLLLILVSNTTLLGCVSNLPSDIAAPVLSTSPPTIWQIESYEIGDNISTFTEQEINSLVGEKVVISNNLVVLFGDSCKTPNNDSEVKKMNMYLYEFYGQRSPLSRKKDNIEVINLNCNEAPKYNSDESPNFSWVVMLLDDNTAILPYNGVFFYLSKVKQNVYQFDGHGNKKKELVLEGTEEYFKLDYNFLKEEDKLVLKDQNGNILFSTEMQSTEGFESTTLKLEKGITSLTIEIKASEASSKWEIKYSSW